MRPLMLLLLLCIIALCFAPTVAFGADAGLRELKGPGTTIKSVKIDAWLFDEGDQRKHLLVDTDSKEFISDLEKLLNGVTYNEDNPNQNTSSARVVHITLKLQDRELELWISHGEHVWIGDEKLLKVADGTELDRVLLTKVLRKHWHLVQDMP